MTRLAVLADCHDPQLRYGKAHPRFMVVASGNEGDHYRALPMDPAFRSRWHVVYLDDLPEKTRQRILVERCGLDGFAFGTATPALAFADHPDLAVVRRAFDLADGWLERFLKRYGDERDVPIRRRLGWREEPVELTPRWLFSHTETHESHHKGQVVMLGRALGFPPPETDLQFPWDA